MRINQHCSIASKSLQRPCEEKTWKEPKKQNQTQAKFGKSSSLAHVGNNFPRLLHPCFLGVLFSSRFSTHSPTTRTKKNFAKILFCSNDKSLFQKGILILNDKTILRLGIVLLCEASQRSAYVWGRHTSTLHNPSSRSSTPSVERDFTYFFSKKTFFYTQCSFKMSVPFSKM